VQDTATAYGTVSDVSLLTDPKTDERPPTMADSVRQELNKRKQAPQGTPQ